MNIVNLRGKNYVRRNEWRHAIAFLALFILGLLLCSSTLKADASSNTPNEHIETVKTKAEQGDVWAQCVLGICFDNGYGVPEDKAEAVNWFRKAAEQGDAWAQRQLGDHYYNSYASKGDGAPEDEEEALKWYRMAAGQGDRRAQVKLGDYLRRIETYSSFDPEGSSKWYRMAAEQGDLEAQKKLGFDYRIRGIISDVPEFKEEAVKWYRMAAEQGDAEAQRHLGDYYFNGDGAPEDKEEAVRWYRMAAEQGDLWAQIELEECYAKGKGVEKNKEEAKKWRQKAADQGYDHARAIRRDILDWFSDCFEFIKDCCFWLCLLYVIGKCIKKIWLRIAHKKNDTVSVEDTEHQEEKPR